MVFTMIFPQEASATRGRFVFMDWLGFLVPYGRLSILRLDPVQAGPVRRDGLRKLVSNDAKVFVIP